MNKVKMTLSVGLAFLLAVPVFSAETRISVQQAIKGGLTPTRTSSGLNTTDTYKFRNDGKVFILFEKTGAGSCTVTITTPNTSDGLAISDQTVTVAASTGDVVVGPLSPSLFNDASGDVSFTLSDTVGLSIAVIRL